MRGRANAVLVLFFRHQQFCRDHDQRQSADQLQIRQLHQADDDAGEDDAQNNGGAGAEDHAPQALPRRQSTAGERDHQRVVAGEQDVDPDDLADGDPKDRRRHLVLELGKEGRDRRGIKDLPQRIHSTSFSALRPLPAAIVRRLWPNQPTISLPEKNCTISIAAVSVASEPCTEFSPIDLA